MKKIRVRATLTEPMLGTSPNNEEIYREFFAPKAPNDATADEEAEALSRVEEGEKKSTVFPRGDSGRPIIYDYQIKGFFKDACSMLARLTGKDPETGKKLKASNESGKLTAYKKIIDGLIFPSPREIDIHFDGEIGVCQRPLRAQTAQGERVALAMSEQVPAGATIEFTVKCLDENLVSAVREWLDYGEVRGLGQWRNSGMGRFLWDELDEDGNVIGGNHGNEKARKYS